MTSYPVTPLENLPLLLLRRKPAGFPVAALSENDIPSDKLRVEIPKASLVGAGNAAS